MRYTWMTLPVLAGMLLTACVQEPETTNTESLRTEVAPQAAQKDTLCISRQGGSACDIKVIVPQGSRGQVDEAWLNALRNGCPNQSSDGINSVGESYSLELSLTELSKASLPSVCGTSTANPGNSR